MIRERTAEEEDDNNQSTISEKHKYFKLLKIVPKEQQSNLPDSHFGKGASHRGTSANSDKKRKINAENSIDYIESSFDSIIPDDLIVHSFNSRKNNQGGTGLSNYNSHASQASKLSKFSKL